MNYYDVTGDFEYIERAVAAARASFALMIIDENKDICPRNYQGEDHNGYRHGSSAENYGHGGRDERSGQSGFHWGVGSALTTAYILKERYADLLIDLRCNKAVGTDGIAVESCHVENNAVKLAVKTLAGCDCFTIKIINSDERTAVVVEGFTVEGGTARRDNR
jgi:hypothetical protein